MSEVHNHERMQSSENYITLTSNSCFQVLSRFSVKYTPFMLTTSEGHHITFNQVFSYNEVHDLAKQCASARDFYDRVMTMFVDNIAFGRLPYSVHTPMDCTCSADRPLECNACALATCKVCGEFERGLTTHCCGRPLNQDEK
jgi:hypothetical protein